MYFINSRADTASKANVRNNFVDSNQFLFFSLYTRLCNIFCKLKFRQCPQLVVIVLKDSIPDTVIKLFIHSFIVFLSQNKHRVEHSCFVGVHVHIKKQYICFNISHAYTSTKIKDSQINIEVFIFQ